MRAFWTQENMNNQQVSYSLHGWKFSGCKTVKETRCFTTLYLWYSLQFNIHLLFKVLASEVSKIMSKSSKTKDFEAKRQQSTNLPFLPEFVSSHDTSKILRIFHLPTFIVFTQIHPQKSQPMFGTSFGQNQFWKGWKNNKITGCTIPRPPNTTSASNLEENPNENPSISTKMQYISKA